MTELTAARFQAPPFVERVQRNALIVGAVGAALAVVGFLVDPAQFYRSYLIAFIYWVAIPLGSLALLMVHHLSGGGWGMPIRRILEASSRTVPFMLVLFLPILFGLHHLYEWTHADVVASDPVVRHKAPYLNTQFFVIRLFIYFAVWSALAYTLSNWSRRQDHAFTPGSERKFRLLSGPGLVLYGVTSTFASVDWIMSLDVHWFSTIFGLLFLIQHALGALAFTILMVAALARREPLAEVIKPLHTHDLGKLLLAFTMVWAYFSFSQYLIIWSANLPEEIPWYVARTTHGWEWVSLAVLVGQFFIPFSLLLSKKLKRNPQRLARIAVWVLLMRYVDFFWIMAPALHREAPYISWLDVVTLAGVGGIWIALFAWQYRGPALLPVGDPYLREALAGHGAAH